VSVDFNQCDAVINARALEIVAGHAGTAFVDLKRDQLAARRLEGRITALML
jgi:hypothetical protein